MRWKQVKNYSEDKIVNVELDGIVKVYGASSMSIVFHVH